MAEPRKVHIVTLSAFTATPPPGTDNRNQGLDPDSEPSLSWEPELGTLEVSGSVKAPGQSETVRINISLTETSDLSSPEYSYRELLQYDELVPASVTTKLGGFYINTGTLHFRNTFESESNYAERHNSSRGDEDEEEVKKKKRKDEEEVENKRKNNCLTKKGVCRPERKRRKRLMLAAMLRRFAREKKEIHKETVANSTQLLHSDALLSDLTSDPAMMSLLTSSNESKLQDLLSDLDFSSPDTEHQTHLTHNGPVYPGVGLGVVGGDGLNHRVGVACPSPLPEGLPAPLVKRIEDLRVASRQFDAEGRKKFFTLDMNNILLDIELQVQEQSTPVRSAVYSHLEAFVPCNKEALLKRLKKLSLNIQDDHLRAPLLKLKLAVCSVMPEQTARYTKYCMAKVTAKQQVDDGESNRSEDEEEEKPGKRVMGPRKKFIWDDRLRTLLCNLVRVKLRCYDQKSSLSVEDYLKIFMESEVKPLWPKGWMQTRILFKESRAVHGHLTDMEKKRTIPTHRSTKIKETGWHLLAEPGVNPASFSTHPPSEPICLSDSLDEDLAANSQDSIAHALSLLTNSADGVNPNVAPSPSSSSSSSPIITKPHLHTQSHTLSSQSSTSKDVSSVQRQTSRPSSTSTNTMPSAKPRPPPTTTPLQKPFGAVGVQCGQATSPVSHIKNTSNRLCKTTPPSPSPLLQKKIIPTGQRFITPMQATLTKSSQSSNSPIIKLTHRSPAQTTPSACAHRPSSQASPPGSTNSHPAQTTPPFPAQHPFAQTHHPPAQTTPGSAHRPPAQTVLPGSTHHPPAQTTPPIPAQRSHVQTTLSGSFHHPSTHTVPSGSTHCSSVSTPSPPDTTHQPKITTTPSVPGNRNPGSVPKSHGLSLAKTFPSSSSNNHRSVSTPPSPSSLRPLVQTPPSSVYRPSLPTPPNLSHRSPVATPPSVSSPSPSSHPSVPTSPTLYSPKSSGFKPAFTSAHVATPHTSSFQDCNLISSSATTNHGQRQRAVGGASQSNKSSANCASAVGLSLSDSALLNQVSSVPLGLGMFGGLVPVSLPFQFPVLNFTPPGAATLASNSGYTLTQNLFNSLQSGVQAALPPHLQLAFSELNQSQGEVKRK